MRASFSELVERESGDALRDPLLRKGRPLVVDVDEVLLQANSFSRNVVSEIAGWLAGSTSAVAAIMGQQPVAAASRFDPSRALFSRDAVTFLLQVLGEGRPVYLCSETYPEPM